MLQIGQFSNSCVLGNIFFISVYKDDCETWCWTRRNLVSVGQWRDGVCPAVSALCRAAQARQCHQLTWNCSCHQGTLKKEGCSPLEFLFVLKEKEDTTANERQYLPDLENFLNLLNTSVYLQFGWPYMPLLITDFFVSFKQYLFKKIHVLTRYCCLQNKWAQINNAWKIQYTIKGHLLYVLPLSVVTFSESRFKGGQFQICISIPSATELCLVHVV